MTIEEIWLAIAIAVPIVCIAFAVAVVVDMIGGNKMKTTIPPTRKQIERVAEQCSHEIIECLQDENAINLIATIRFFGLGKKRARQYLDFLTEVKSEFARHGYDGIIRYKVEEELDSVGIKISEIYEQPESIKEVLRQRKAQKKTVSLAEAYALSKQMKRFERISEEWFEC